jgi:hypothetical protein
MANPKLTVSSEFLSHYKAASIMPADAAFSALQTTEGHALLFSVGTDNVCYLTQESPGGDAAKAAGWQNDDSKAGWRKVDLSSALKPSGVTGAKQIAVAQRIPTTTSSGTADPKIPPNIHMALVATTSGDDLLHLNLNNSASDTSWVGKLSANDSTPYTSWVGVPNWSAHAFDDDTRPFGSQVKISNVFISEAADGEYIVVDLLNQSDNTICRYFIDPAAKSDPANSLGTGKAWNQHPVPDIDPNTISSVHGRRTDGSVYDGVDGLYTMG